MSKPLAPLSIPGKAPGGLQPLQPHPSPGGQKPMTISHSHSGSGSGSASGSTASTGSGSSSGSMGTASMSTSGKLNGMVAGPPTPHLMSSSSSSSTGLGIGDSKHSTGGGGYLKQSTLSLGAPYAGSNTAAAGSRPTTAAGSSHGPGNGHQSGTATPSVNGGNGSPTLDAASGSAASVPPTNLGVSSLKQINDAIPNEVRELREHFASIAALSVKHYTLHATLGTGTFGRVRLVSYEHKGKQHWFALKMLKKTEIIRLKQVDHIKAEKAILCRITHPFIVNLYAHFQDERSLFMCMEYVIGGELFSQLRKVGRFHNDVSRFYAAEIVLALEYLHDRNIVYRDLKPENLLIDRDGHIKITDFGFAKLVEDRTWTLCGTPEYLAPEIIQSKGHGKAVDWWALGILVYEMLAGYPPFYDENPFGIYQKILAGKIEFPRHFDPNAKDLVKKLLQPDRSKRFGCLKNGAEDIKRHKWFKDLNWTDCYKRVIKPPFIPAYTSPNDTSNFDKYPDSDSEKNPPAPAASAAAVATATAASGAKEKDLFADF